MNQPSSVVSNAEDTGSRSLRCRLVFVSSVLVFFLVYVWSYYEFLLPWQEYWGFSSRPLKYEEWALLGFLAVLPSFWIPVSLRRPSQVLFLFQYVAIFLPAVLILPMAGRPSLPLNEALIALIVFSGGLVLMGASYAVPLMNIRKINIRPFAYWTAMLIAVLLLAGVVFITIGANFQAVGLDRIYEVRSGAAELVQAGNRFSWYAQLWLAGAFLPLIFAYGCFRKKYSLVIPVTIAYLLLFGLTGTKSTLLAAVILAALVIAIRISSRQFSTVIVVGFSIALITPVFFFVLGDYAETVEKWYVVLVHARVFGVPQLIIAQYVGFFSDHPVTLWSHVTGMSAIISYPYEIDVPRTVGEFYYGSPVGLNGGLWVQDGIGAAGYPGVFLISAVCTLVFWIFDSLTASVPVGISAPSLGFVTVWFTNAPLGTTLLSGGFALLALLMWLYPATQKRPAADLPRT